MLFLACFDSLRISHTAHFLLNFLAGYFGILSGLPSLLFGAGMLPSWRSGAVLASWCRNAAVRWCRPGAGQCSCRPLVPSWHKKTIAWCNGFKNVIGGGVTAIAVTHA